MPEIRAPEVGTMVLDGKDVPIRRVKFPLFSQCGRCGTSYRFYPEDGPDPGHGHREPGECDRALVRRIMES